MDARKGEAEIYTYVNTYIQIYMEFVERRCLTLRNGTVAHERGIKVSGSVDRP